MKKIAFLLLLLISSVTQAALVNTATTKIKKIESYNQYNGGDVYFSVETSIFDCADGFWLTKSDPGFSANMAFLLSAYHAKSPIMVHGHSDQIWPGSGGRFCKLYSVALM